MEEKVFLTIGDVCELTGYSKGTIYQMTHKKQIPHYKPKNGALLFKRQEVEEWISKSKVV